MKTFKATVLALVCALGWSSLAAAAERPRQYYTPKMVYDRDNDYFRGAYYFKAKPSDANYKYHYVIRLKSEPQYLYFYNPATKFFWGRFDAVKRGYSILVGNDRVSRLSDLGTAKFPEPGSMPAIPGSSDGVLMDMPPGEFTPAPPMAPAAPEGARRIVTVPDNPAARPPIVEATTPPATESETRPGDVVPPMTGPESQPPATGPDTTPPPQAGSSPPTPPGAGSGTSTPPGAGSGTSTPPGAGSGTSTPPGAGSGTPPSSGGENGTETKKKEPEKKPDQRPPQQQQSPVQGPTQQQQTAKKPVFFQHRK